MRQARTLLAAALLCAAGCQSDLALRPVDERIAYARSLRDADGVVIVSDTRHVVLDFESPPVDDDIEGDMVFAYLSIPLHPVQGFQWNNPSIGGGWSNMAMSFTGVFQPLEFLRSAHGWEYFTGNDSLTKWLADHPQLPMSAPRLDVEPVDPRFAEYAAAAWDDVYQRGAPVAEVLAQSASTSSAAAEDD